MNEWKCEDFKCVWKPTESRLCLTHYVNKSSRMPTLQLPEHHTRLLDSNFLVRMLYIDCYQYIVKLRGFYQRMLMFLLQHVSSYCDTILCSTTFVYNLFYMFHFNYMYKSSSEDEIANVNVLRRHRRCRGQSLRPLKWVPDFYCN